MEQNQPSSPAMRVSIVSVSRNQREHLKRLIEQHGPRVVGMSGFRDHDLARDEIPPDVLLVDLDQADDLSLTRIERLLEQSDVPVLFNESTAVPTTPGPYRDDWVDNLVGKLYNLATQRRHVAKSGLSNRPRYAQTVGHTLPNVLIVSHSKTRRRVLQIILAAQGLRDSTETSFARDDIAECIEHYDALLVDEHNVSPEEQIILSELTTQQRVPVQVCNSSTIPYSALARRQWGIQLAGKIIKLTKLKPAVPTTASAAPAPVHSPTDAAFNNVVAVNGEAEWSNRLSEVLAQVRTNLTHQTSKPKAQRGPARSNATKVVALPSTNVPAVSTPSTTESAELVTSPDQPSLMSEQLIVAQIETRLAESKLNSAAATLGIIEAHKELKDSSAIRSREPAPQTSAVTASIPKPTESVEIKPADSSSSTRPRTITPVRVKQRAPATEIIDATNLDSLPITPRPSLRNSAPTPVEPLPVDARDSEIERFFDFDKELDISQTRHALGEGHILNASTHDEILPWTIEDEPTNPFSNNSSSKKASSRNQKNNRSSWRDSLSGLRKKLPKLFH